MRKNERGSKNRIEIGEGFDRNYFIPKGRRFLLIDLIFFQEKHFFSRRVNSGI